MKYSDIFDKYKTLLDSLKDIIDQSEHRVLKDEPDGIFAENINFFVKSYLITICTYLEVFLQDTAHEHLSRVNSRLTNARIPSNFLLWKHVKEVKDKDLQYQDANLPTEKKKISDLLSGNPYRCINAFKYFGVDLTSEEGFNEHKDTVGSIVDKRNNIIHHNDNASDISFNDLKVYVGVFVNYMKSIYSCVEKQDAGTSAN